MLSDTLPLHLARAFDPEAFEYHAIEARSEVARIQWGARRKMAMDAAERLLPWLEAHDAAVRADQIEKDAACVERQRNLFIDAAFIKRIAAAIRAQLTEPDHPCGDYPAPCNCDDPEAHGGHR